MPPFCFSPVKVAQRPSSPSQNMRMTGPESTLFDRSDLAPLLLQPPQVERQELPSGTEMVTLTTGDANFDCRFTAASRDASTLLYFHGGNESADTFTPEAQEYRQAGLNLFLFSYRGFAGSTGTPSLSSLLADADAQMLQALTWLEEKGYTGARFVVGRCLGSLCAVDIVNRRQENFKGLILESSYCQALPLLRNLGREEPSEISDDDGFQMLSKLAGIKLATSFFHGAKDPLVPIAQAEKLQAASGAKSKQFLLVPGAMHGNIAATAGHLYYKAIRTFTDTVCGRNTWRERRQQFKVEKNEHNK